MKTTFIKFKNILHASLTVVLILPFLSASISKLIPSFQTHHPNYDFLIRSVNENNYKAPAAFELTMVAMQQSGFFIMIGCVQLISCLLMAIPRSRLIGLLLLLPITFTIFMMQLIMNENVMDTLKSSALLFINLLLVVYYYNKIRLLWIKKESIDANAI